MKISSVHFTGFGTTPTLRKCCLKATCFSAGSDPGRIKQSYLKGCLFSSHAYSFFASSSLEDRFLFFFTCHRANIDLGEGKRKKQRSRLENDGLLWARVQALSQATLDLSEKTRKCERWRSKVTFWYWSKWKRSRIR